VSLINKFATVGGATLASRVMGFARDMLIAATLGAGPVADVFVAAFGFPNLFRRTFAEGAFNLAFIPLFAKKIEADGEKSARQFAEEILAMLVAILLLFTALAMLAMPYLVPTIIAPRFDDPNKIDLTIIMTRIMFPYLFCLSLVAMLSGIMNSMRLYFLAAIVPVLLNVILVAVLLIAIWLDADERSTGIYLAWGVFVSGFAQLALLLFGTRRAGFPLRLKRPKMTPQVKRLLVLMGPAVLTGGVLQINIQIGRIIASAQDGAMALLNYADRINQLPLGIIGIAIGVVLLPELSRALKTGDQTEVSKLQNRSLEFALMLTLPAAVGFVVIPDELVGLLYERGAFTAETTALTAAALAAYASGLPAYVLIKVFQPAYFAREDMRTPFYFSIVMMITNVGISLWLFPTLGHVGIAIATSLSAWINFVLLAATLWFRGQYRPHKTTLSRVMMIVIASAIMGGVLYFAQQTVSSNGLEGGLLSRAIVVFGLIALSSAIYFAIIIGSGVITRQELKGLTRRGQK